MLNPLGKDIQVVSFDNIPSGVNPFTLTITWHGQWIETGYTEEKQLFVSPVWKYSYKSIKKLFIHAGTSSLYVDRHQEYFPATYYLVYNNRIYFRCSRVTYLEVYNGIDTFVLIDNE